MNTKLLKQKILDLAIRGKLTQQLKSDGTAADLLKQISEQKRESSSTLSSPRRRGSPSAQSEKTIIPLDKSEAPFEIPANWEWVCIDSIASLITDGEHLTPRRVESFEGYYLLSARNIQDNEILLNDVDYVDEDEYNRIAKRCNPRKNDVLISCSGSIGRVTVVRDDNKYVMVRSAAMIRPVFVHSCYLMYVLQSNCLQSQIQNYSKQTAQANLFQAAIRALQFPLPPLTEQQRIVEKIQEAFAEIDSIENNKELLKTHIKQARQKILDLAIHGKLVPQNKTDEPASVLLERITRDNPHYEKIEDEPFEIPENWVWCRLEDVCNQMLDGDWIESKDQSDEGVRLIQTGNIGFGKFKDKEGKYHYISESTFDRLGCTEIFPGDILISRLPEPVGRSCIIPPLKSRMITAVDCTIIRVNNDCTIPKYFLAYTQSNSYFAFVNSLCAGTTRKRISRNNLAQVLFPLPPLNEQSRIVAKIEELFSTLNQMERNIV